MNVRDMFFAEGKEFSERDERLFARQELVYSITEDLLVAMEDLDVSKNELARRLGKSKSFVTQVLSGARNMTLGTLSDICFSLHLKPLFKLRDHSNALYQNTLEDSEWASLGHAASLVTVKRVCANEEKFDWQSINRKDAVGY